MKADVRKHVLPRVGPVLEIDVVKIDAAALHRRAAGAVGNGGLFVQHLENPFGRGHGAAQHQEHVRNHHQGVQNLKHIAQKAGQLAHLQGADGNHVAAEPQDADDGGVHHRLKARQNQHGIMERALRSPAEPLVHRAELPALPVPPHIRFHGADGDQVLLDDGVDVVQRLLHGCIEGAELFQNQIQRAPKNRDGRQENDRQLRAHQNGHREAHQQHGRAAHDGPQPVADGVLQDGDVARESGDQRRRAEMVQIGEGIPLHPAVLRFPQFRAEPLARPGGKARVAGAEAERNQGADPHHQALAVNIRGVAADDADVDDIRHNQRNHKLEHGLEHHAYHADIKVFAVFFKI